MWLDYIILVKLTALGFLQLAVFQSKIRALPMCMFTDIAINMVFRIRESESSRYERRIRWWRPSMVIRCWVFPRTYTQLGNIA